LLGPSRSSSLACVFKSTMYRLRRQFQHTSTSHERNAMVHTSTSHECNAMRAACTPIRRLNGVCEHTILRKSIEIEECLSPGVWSVVAVAVAVAVGAAVGGAVDHRPESRRRIAEPATATRTDPRSNARTATITPNRTLGINKEPRSKQTCPVMVRSPKQARCSRATCCSTNVCHIVRRK
jgi:hypothetical protein